MSFRNRLTLFFVVIVIVPMISVALVLFRLISDSENGQADAGVRARIELVHNLYVRDVSHADSVLRRVVADAGLARALTQGDVRVLTRRLGRLAAYFGSKRAVVTQGGRVLVDVGDRGAVSPASQGLVGAGGRNLGRLELSTVDGRAFAIAAKQAAGVDVSIASPGGVPLASLGLPAGRPLPTLGHLRIRGRDYRVASFDGAGFSGAPLRVSILSSLSETRVRADNRRLLAGAILGGFLLVAFGFAVLVSRSLQKEIGGFLAAARRLGEGDFSEPVRVEGQDEFAALGGEFNKMSAQLEARLAELREQRTRLESALRRVGETFASNLDRDALLEIALRTAVDGVGAQAGRIMAWKHVGGPLEQRAAIGTQDGLGPLLTETAARVASSAEPQTCHTESGWALGHPLLAADGLDDPGSSTLAAAVCVARSDRDFEPGERDLFHYLAAQAMVSIENVDLHETVQRQAVTDELTGLFNQRRFQGALEGEVERARRFDQELGLVMLDIDNFKQVNDRYGHQQGDLVLREVARIMREFSREIDSPARYGGEELAVVLPQTDLEGTFNLAERVRMGIEELELPLLEGSGTMSVTASFGVAVFPDSATEPERLVAAADAALYKAKRSGKNNTVRAQ
jgi:diguanylate cyclase (GGDEF)-like protein